MITHSRYNTARKFLIFWCLFIGIGAVAGAVGMLSEPDGSALGMDKMLPFFQVLPFAEYLFQDFIFSGIALLCVNGITNLIAAGLLFAKKKSGTVCGMIFGITLILWICIQFYIFPMNFMSTTYFIFGLLQALTGYATLIFLRQETFSVNPGDYKNIGKDKSRIVVYFSRMGYTKKAAYEQANKTGAEILEIKSSEKTDGTLGFWWCGRFGMHRWEMPSDDPSIPLNSFEHVTICTPVWVFTLSGVMRSFCKKQSGNIKAADYIIVHFQRARYDNVVSEMDSLLGIRAESAISICCRQGKFIKKTVIRENSNSDCMIHS